MTDTDYEISAEPPRDDDGHPIHPEKGYRICGATKSDKTTPTDHGRERDDVEYCLQRAGWGEDRSIGPCSKHPVTGEQWGDSNPNYEHGAYSDHLRGGFSEREKDAYDDLVKAFDDQEQAQDVVKELAAEAVVKYKRSNDHRFLREVRQLLSEFNVADATDHLDVNGVEARLMQNLRETHDDE